MNQSKPYHVYIHASSSENLFRSDKNLRYFLRQCVNFISAIADYYLMPNRIHSLVRIKNVILLESTFGKFKTFQKLVQRRS